MANELSNLHPVPGEKKKRMRVGRGEGSGKGKTAGRGTKGAQSRSGYKTKRGFEGGQMPMQRRLPKRGFTNIFATEYTEVNVGRLNELPAGTVVTAESLRASGLIRQVGKDGVKLLGRGDVTVALHVRVAKLSESAQAKIVGAGGTVEGDLP